MVKRRTTVRQEINEKYGKMPWGEAIEQFLESMKVKGLAYHTRRWHKENLQAIFKALRIKEYPTEPSMVSESMLKAIVLKMIDDGLSPTTINHRVRSLKKFYEFLVNEKIVDNNPTVKLDRKKTKNMVIQTFTEQQISELLSVTNRDRFVGFRDYTIMLVLLDTGIRLSELANIKLSDLKMADREIVIPHGKGG